MTYGPTFGPVYPAPSFDDRCGLCGERAKASGDWMCERCRADVRLWGWLDMGEGQEDERGGGVEKERAMSDEPELIPCPFCGGDGQYFLACLGTMEAWVPCCTECEAVIDVPFLSKEEAAAAWNRRDWRPEETHAEP